MKTYINCFFGLSISYKITGGLKPEPFLLLNGKQEETQEIVSWKQCSEQKKINSHKYIQLFKICQVYLMANKIMFIPYLIAITIISIFNAHLYAVN